MLRGFRDPDDEILGIVGTSTPPVNTVAPAITGTATVGSTLTCSTGTWDNSPTDYAYQWFAAERFVGLNSSTYVVHQRDGGKPITCVVTARNADGAARAMSDTTAAVPAVPWVFASGYPLTPATGGGLPPGFSWTTYIGEQVTFTGTISGITFNLAPVFDDGSQFYVRA